MFDSVNINIVRKKKKGQISFAEYLVSIIVFISFVGYFSIQLLNFFPTYLSQIRNERVRSEAYQLSEILINDPGFPISWQNIIQSNPSQVKRVGLNDETQNVTNLISMSKLNTFITQCQSNYMMVKQLLGATEDFSIIVTVINSNSNSVQSVLVCSPTNVVVRSVNVTIQRFAAIDSSHYSDMILQVV